jgi:hypothetical protein
MLMADEMIALTATEFTARRCYSRRFTGQTQ